MKKEKIVGIIGFGNMGTALGEGLKNKGWKVLIYDKEKKRLKGIKKILVSSSARELIKNSPLVIIAVKPQDISFLVDEIREAILTYNPLLISIAAGVSTQFFEDKIPKVRIVRVMPNLAAKKRESISFISKGRYVIPQEVKIVEEIFKCIGDVVVTREEFLDKVTAISGSGPGYVYYFMNSIYRVALSLGFSKSVAKEMVIKTFWGAVSIIKDSKEDFSFWIKKVASPKGTTEAAINFWKSCNLEKLIQKGVRKAYLRAKQLSLKS